MKIISEKSFLKGEVRIPPSKSHSIRAIAFASLAKGESKIKNYLNSADVFSCISTYRQLGAKIVQKKKELIIKGGKLSNPSDIVDVGNSGTTLRIALGTAALLEDYTIFTGDEQIKRRTCKPLLNALNKLGAKVISINNGCCPIIVKGYLKGGKATVECLSSQFVTSLLINCPLAPKDTLLKVKNLNEVPYIEMTLWWLKKLGIKLEYRDDLTNFYIKGSQSYSPFTITVPGDFSSATFFLCAGVLCAEELIIKGLDMTDTQGDKAVIDYLKDMGADIKIQRNKVIVKRSELKGIDIDMNKTPDALPAMAVVGAFAKGITRLLNVPQARIKETDRISVMCKELQKAGVKVEELPDGLCIRESKPHPTCFDGHKDHRVIMALSIMGLIVGKTRVMNAEAINITFPEYVNMMESVGAKMSLLSDEEKD